MRWFKGAVACATTACLAGCSQTAPFIAASPAAAFTTTACPADLGRLQDVIAPTRPLDRLVSTRPSPSAAVICEYGSIFNQGAGARHTLAKQIDLLGAPAKTLASAAARIAVGTSESSGGCPNDSGSVTVVAFGYRDAPPTDLWWRTTGCQTIDNGAIEAEQVGNSSFGDFQTVFADVTRGATSTTR